MARRDPRLASFLAFALAASSWLLVGAAEAPALPKDIAPLSPDLAKKIEQLKQAAENYRGLPYKQPVACGSLERETLRKKMLEAVQEELPSEKMAALEAGLKAFGFIPREMVLAKYLPELLTSQVGGFYDPKRKYLVILQDSKGGPGKAAEDQMLPGLTAKVEEIALVHELTHAIQDQHFDLEKFEITEPLSDEGAARTALIEGDATLAMYDFGTGMRLENFPGMDKIMGQFFKDPKQLTAMMPDMPGSKELADAPAWFRDNLLFSYLEGFSFCVAVRKAGGQKLLDYAFSKDPPRSTEQIIHPEKWLAKRDDPVVITWPDLTQDLPAHKKLCEGQLGELNIKVLLRENLKNGEKAAAAGWGGDRFAVYGKDQNTVLLWITEWDSTQAAKEFKEAAAALGPDWSIAAPAPSRVVLIRGQLDAAPLAAVHAKLAAAKAQVPANKNIDFAALGITPAGKGEGGGLLGALEGVLEGKEELDFAKLLNDPEIQKAAAKMLQQVDQDNPGGLDLGKAAADPQKLMETLLTKKQPPGKLSADGRTYTNEKLGLKVGLPPSLKDWKMEAQSAGPVAVLITSPQSAVQVSVALQPMPFTLPIESMGPMLEMGQQMALKNYKKLSGAVIQTSGHKGFELQCEGDIEGQRERSTMRFYSANGALLVLSAMAQPEDWDRNEKAIGEALGSFSFIEAQPEPAKEK
ncbi:MAG: hypothetical protein ABSE73_03695 [Planctomycetota bacterium]